MECIRTWNREEEEAEGGRDALAPFSGLFNLKGTQTARLRRDHDGKRLEDTDRRATAAGVSENGSKYNSVI